MTARKPRTPAQRRAASPEVLAGERPLELSPEQLRAMIDGATRAILAHLETLPEQPMHATGGGQRLARSLREPMPERGEAFHHQRLTAGIRGRDRTAGDQLAREGERGRGGGLGHSGLRRVEKRRSVRRAAGHGRGAATGGEGKIMKHQKIILRLSLAALLLAVAGAAAARDYHHPPGYGWPVAPRGPTSTTLSGTLPQGRPMPRPGPYYTLPSPGGRTEIHDFSGQRYGTLERETGSRPPVVYAPDGRRRYETDRDGTLRDPYGRRIEVLKPLPDGDW